MFVVQKPTEYSPALSAELCKRISEGQTLQQIFEAPDMPTLGRMYEWLDSHPDFAANYARAYRIQADVYAGQIIDLADQCRVGKIIDETMEGGVAGDDGVVRGGTLTRKVRTADMVERAKLQVQARQWTASRRAPHLYGDRTALQMLDEQGQPARAGVVIVLGGAANKALEPREK